MKNTFREKVGRGGLVRGQSQPLARSLPVGNDLKRYARLERHANEIWLDCGKLRATKPETMHAAADHIFADRLIRKFKRENRRGFAT